MLYLIPLIAAILPFFLWPLETFLPHPYIIEELAKLFLILPIREIKDNLSQVKLGFVVGFLFAISESTLYIFNIAKAGSTTTFLERLALTVPLHVMTVLVLIYFATRRNKINIIWGFSTAFLIHILFNYSVKYIIH